MAKAVEWAERFETAPDLGEELRAFIDEIGAISAARGNTANAVEGAVREQKAKFLSACNHTSKVNPQMWPVLMQAHGKVYMDGVQTYLRQEARRQQKGRSRGKPARNRRPS